MSDTTLYDETFTITTIDSSKYDRVSRLVCTSTATADTSMTLDVNTELYPCQTGETIQCVIATSLSLDGTKDDEGKGWRDLTRRAAAHGASQSTLADMYDYVCRGKIYRFEEGGGQDLL